MTAVRSVERAFAILRAIAERGTATLGAIADRADLPKSTVSRLLRTLESEGVVSRLGGRGRFGLGPGLTALAGNGSSPALLSFVAQPYLRDLVAEFGEDAGLAVEEAGQVLYTDQIQTEGPVQVQDWTGDRFPLHVVAAGFIFLAGRSDDGLEDYLRRSLSALTEKTLTAEAALRRRVARVRADGHAWTYEEWADGVNGAAAAVRNGGGAVLAAITLYGPAYRFPGEADPKAIGRRLSVVADQVSGRLRDATETLPN